MAMKKSPTTLEIAAAALAELEALRRKYRAERAAIFAEILRRDPHGTEPSDEKVDAASSFQARIRERLNGHATLAGMPAETISVGKLRRDLAEVDYVLDRVLANDEIAKRAALHAALAIDRKSEWDADDTEMADLLLRIKRLAVTMGRKSQEALVTAGGLARDRRIDGYLGSILMVEGLIYSMLEDFVIAGTISEKQNAAAGE